MDPIARVLIVDDEVEQATALSATLAEQGYETSAVSSAAEGLTALRSARRLLHLTRQLLEVAKPGCDSRQ